MITHRLIQLPFSPPATYFVRSTWEEKEKKWIFFEKKVKKYKDSDIGTLSQIEQYIKENNIEISKGEFW